MKDRMDRIKIYFTLSLIGGALSALAWFPFSSGLVLLISFVPFFLIASSTKPGHERFGNRMLFIRVLPGFLLFNVIALFWVRIAGIPLLITVITGNTFLMAFTFWLAWLVKQKAGKITGSAAFVLFWLTMEYATNNVPVLSPWLNLGNGLASETRLIQWYEATGVAGGTLWILLSNITIAHIINMHSREKRKLLFPVAAAIAIITLPVLISLMMQDQNRQGAANQPLETVIIQPCKDPYTEKFTTSFEVQLDTILSMAKRAATPDTRWFITPETTIHDPINLESIDSNRYIIPVRNFLRDYPRAVFLLGAVTFSETHEKTLHNSSILISEDGVAGIYHKSKLVPGIERSFRGPSRFLQKIFPELGGTTGGYSGQDYHSILEHHTVGTSAAPVICFESAFGDYVTGFVREGAGIITVITNDGWWKNTYGYYQHLTFSSLRAVETRRPVLRAANTGVSAIIETDGKIIAQLPWWEAGTITETVTPESKITFYVKYGDLISRSATSLTLFILAIHMIAIPIRRRVSEKKIL